LLLGSLGASRSTVPMPGKSTYRHATKSITSSTDAAPAAGEGYSAIDITASRSPPMGVALSLHPRAPSPRPRHSSQPQPVTPMSLGAVVTAVIRPSSKATAATRGGGAPDSSTAVATANPSSTYTRNGSVHGGWGRGSEGTTRTLWAKRFRGAVDGRFWYT
jgi:hypothetical protein